MKRSQLHLYVVAFFLVSQSISIVAGKHHLLDSIQVTEVNIPTAIDSGVGAVWDYSHVRYKPLPEYLYIWESEVGEFDCHLSRAHSYVYKQSDIICLIGKENSLSSCAFSAGEKLYHSPMSYGDSTLSSEYFIHGEYGQHVPFQTICRSQSQIAGKGVLKFPYATMDSVLCVHVSRSYYRVGFDSPYLFSHLYLWFQNDSIMPIMSCEYYSDSVRIIKQNAYVYGDIEKDLNPVQQTDTHMAMLDSNQEENLITNVSFLPNPVISDLQICYSLSQSSTVYYSVHYEGGLLAYSTPSHVELDGDHTATLHLGYLPQGTYVVYIHAGESICSGVVLKL